MDFREQYVTQFGVPAAAPCEAIPGHPAGRADDLSADSSVSRMLDGKPALPHRAIAAPRRSACARSGPPHLMAWSSEAPRIGSSTRKITSVSPTSTVPMNARHLGSSVRPCSWPAKENRLSRGSCDGRKDERPDQGSDLNLHGHESFISRGQHIPTQRIQEVKYRVLSPALPMLLLLAKGASREDGDPPHVVCSGLD